MRFPLKSAIVMIRRPGESFLYPQMRNYWQVNRSALTAAGILTAAFLFCYAGVLRRMASQWWNNDVYSYGFLIPCISLYLIWVRRERLALIEPVSDFSGGLTVVFGGLFLLVLGDAAKVLLIQELSLIVTLAGVVLLVLGRGFLRALWFPIAYLLLMVPVWDFITDRLHLPFQNFSSSIGLTILQGIGIPVYRQGVFIELPNVTLEVAKACSGVNYLIAVVAIGIPIAYVALKGWIRRAVLIGMAVAIAVLANGARVALIGTLSYYGLSGGGDIHGPLHVLQGMFVSVIGYAALFGGVWALSPTPSSAPEKGDDSVGPLQPRLSGRAFSTGVILLSAILLLTGSYLHFYRAIPVPLKKDLKLFPNEIGEWKGSDAAPNPSFLGLIDAKQTLSRVYRHVSGAEVHLYVGYFDFQDQERKLISYKTDRLFQNGAETEVAVPPRSIRVNEQILQEEDRRELVLFWYELNGNIFTDRSRAKLYTMWNTLAHRRSNGALVLLSIDAPKEADLERPRFTIERFIPAVFPELANYLPKE